MASQRIAFDPRRALDIRLADYENAGAPLTPAPPVRYASHLVPELGTESHRVRHIELLSTGNNGQPENKISGLYYEHRAVGAKSLVIVLPIWGSHTYPSRKITRSILRHVPETHVFHLLGENRLIDWDAMAALDSEAEVLPAIEGAVERMQVAVSDVGGIVDWATARPEIDPDRVGIVGFSLGALVASIALAHEPRLAAGVVVMGAAELHDVVAVCPGGPARAREHVLSRFGWTLDDYREAFRTAFAPLDASYRTPRLDPRRVLMIDAERDACMPAHARDELWRRLGRPERITYLYGHKRAFLAMTPLGLNQMRRHICRFLDRVLGEPLSGAALAAR